MVTLFAFLFGGSAVFVFFFVGVCIGIPGLFFWPLLVPAGWFIYLGTETWTYMTTAYWVWAITILCDLVGMILFVRDKMKKKSVVAIQRSEPRLTT